MPGTGPLKLRAHDRDDLEALAACLQDALVPVSDIAYLKPEKRFVMVANRFRWEAGARPVPGAPDAERDIGFEEAGQRPLYERVHCGVCFDRVRKARFRALDPRQKGRILNLMTLASEPGAITLVFSGGAAIRLEVSDIRCHMEDLGEPWPTRWRPTHDEAEAAPRDPG